MCLLGPSPRDWRTMIHQNIVLTVLHTPWDMWSMWKTVRTTLKCIDVLQSWGEGPNYHWNWVDSGSQRAIYIISCFLFCCFWSKFYKKNPAYGRQRISWSMRIVGQIKFWRGCVIHLVFFCVFLRGCGIFLKKKRKKRGGRGDQWEARIWSANLRANNRPQKNFMKGDSQKDRKTDIATLWKNLPKGRFFKNGIQKVYIWANIARAYICRQNMSLNWGWNFFKHYSILE